ncbi:MAG: hypothetical protein PF589_02460 [Gammaproteobacteria bacterium]|jgi:hypothetical protein|nr:hypothetical protein [Gammaproteobacteria bacterium]
MFGIINHTNLFGGGYHGQTISMLEQVLMVRFEVEYTFVHQLAVLRPVHIPAQPAGLS